MKERIELHVRTKMSEMNSVLSVDDLMEAVCDRKMEAVAITDTMSVQSYPGVERWKLSKAGKAIKMIYGIEMFVAADEGDNAEEIHKATILVKNENGKRTLYRLLSDALMKNEASAPCVSRRNLFADRGDFLIGSAGSEGDLFQELKHCLVSGKPVDDDVIEKIAKQYDYLELYPDRGDVRAQKVNQIICNIGEKLGIPVVAVANACYLDKKDEEVFRVVRYFAKDIKKGTVTGNHFMTTEEMLSAFSYLGEKTWEVVVENTYVIAGQIEDFEIVPKKMHLPVIEGSLDMIRETCERKLAEMFGDNVPAAVLNRYQEELAIITERNYSVYYVYAMKLAEKGREDRLYVSARGTAGDSFIAYLLGITVVNPLPEEFGGVDLPYEAFLGYEGSKAPDFDLNVSGWYQKAFHDYMGKIFPNATIIRCGTIGTISDWRAEEYLMQYEEETGNFPVEREDGQLVKMLCGVKRGGGQHPGGLIVIPEDADIYSITPLQYLESEEDLKIIKSHMYYYSIDTAIEHFDILGFDPPEILSRLRTMTGVEPEDIPLDDPAVMSLYTGTEALGIEPEDLDGIFCGMLGVPEFEYQYAMKFLEFLRPQNLRQLVKISALVHGTSVWEDNAKVLISDGKATLDDVISSREEIMNFLVRKGMDRKEAFKIMKLIQMGRPAHGQFLSEWEEYKKDMLRLGVPEWYVWSCEKIEYLFSYAHAYDYVLTSWKIAYYKLYYPEAFYQVIFDVRCNNQRAIDCIKKGRKEIDERLEELTRPDRIELTFDERDELRFLLLGKEMLARGISASRVFS